MNKQNRIWIILVAILVIVNIASLGLLWKGQSRMDFRNGKHPHQERGTEKIMRQKLKLDDQQMIEFRKSTQAHFQKIKPIEKQLREKKKQLFQNNLNGISTEDSQDLMNEISHLHLQVDSLTYVHFAELRSYCRQDQIDEFDQFLKMMLRREFGERKGANERPPRTR